MNGNIALKQHIVQYFGSLSYYCVPLLAVKTHRSKVGTLVSIISNHESIVIISTHSIL